MAVSAPARRARAPLRVFPSAADPFPDFASRASGVLRLAGCFVVPLPSGCRTADGCQHRSESVVIPPSLAAGCGASRRRLGRAIDPRAVTCGPGAAARLCERGGVLLDLGEGESGRARSPHAPRRRRPARTGFDTESSAFDWGAGAHPPSRRRGRGRHAAGAPSSLRRWTVRASPAADHLPDRRGPWALLLGFFGAGDRSGPPWRGRRVILLTALTSQSVVAPTLVYRVARKPTGLPHWGVSGGARVLTGRGSLLHALSAVLLRTPGSRPVRVPLRGRLQCGGRRARREPGGP